MNTVGYIFILVAFIVVRGITRGRTLAELPTDISDIVQAVIELDTAKLSGIMGRTGTGLTTDNTASSTIPTEQTPATPGGSGASAFASAPDIVTFARKQIGKPYSWGASGPDKYDCSGLVYAAYKSVGMTVQRTTMFLRNQGSAVAQKDLQPGDLVFPIATHVQIYSGNGKIIEAAKPGTLVREVPMWGFMQARRIPQTTPSQTSPNAAAGTGASSGGGGDW